jgi:hypothetical protein
MQARSERPGLFLGHEAVRQHVRGRAAVIDHLSVPVRDEDSGPPGPRPHRPGGDGAFAFDLDGLSIEAVRHRAPGAAKAAAKRGRR